MSRDIADYPEGIIIPIDKPYRWTSADVIRKVKYAAIRHFGKKNLKVGHAGTLDPLATGILLVCIGKATKLAETLQSHDKEYIAGITFGATTPSYDLEKEIDRFFPHEHISSESVEAALPAFLGEQDQIAPLFSAKSVDGVRAYELARRMYRNMECESGSDSGLSEDSAGSEIDKAAQELIRVSRINITELELLDFVTGNTASEGVVLKTDPAEPESTEKSASGRINVTDNSSLGLPRAVVRLACSKGTYVRAFARDLGEALHSGAHLDSLQRSRSGIFRIENAMSVDQVLEILASPGRPDSSEHPNH